MKNQTGTSSSYSTRDLSTTFMKGLTVLRVFDDTHTRLTLAEISTLAGLDSASVRRLVLTLVHLGYVEKDGRHFTLSPKVLMLAGSYLRGNQFGTHIQPLLNRYALKLGSTVSVAMNDGETAVYVAQSTSPDENVTFGFTVGSRLPILHSAIGRMLLACADPDWAAKVIRTTPIHSYTPKTLMDREQLAEAVRECRSQGYAIVDGEFDAGVTGFSVPIGGMEQVKAVASTTKVDLAVREDEQRAVVISQLRQLAAELARTRTFGGGLA